MSFWPILIVGATLFVAYASGTAAYRKALDWATVTTLAGSIAALFPIFQGKGGCPGFFRNRSHSSSP